jgi:integrator complex subunit 3
MAMSKLMHRSAYETIEELERELQQSYTSFQTVLTSSYHLSHSPATTPQLLQAILYAILTSPNPSSSSSYLTRLTAVTASTSDGYAPFVDLLYRLVNEFYPKLLEWPRSQILWLLRQLIKLDAVDVEPLCLSLLRQVSGGDLSSGNVWLAEELLDILQTNVLWLDEKPSLFTMALYTYLRLLPDHTMATSKVEGLTELRQKETTFCVRLLREKFHDCILIGRDLIRLLQDVSLIPEFECIWRDLLSNPAAFRDPGFGDIAQLYAVRTPTRYLTYRITPDMEAQIRFMLTSVRMGSQRRNQTWFAQRYLSTPESETLVCDLIRFICCVHHPTNQILQSDIVPRWAIVGWLLKCCKSNHVEANAKLALFYDWLFFMSKVDNIMNIEPAILLMVHSIPKYVNMTHSLLEFLFLLIDHYDPVHRDLIQKGVTSSIDILVGKGVVRSLEPLSACNLVASWLREKLHVYFPLYCKPDMSEEAGKHAKPELLQPDGALGMKTLASGGYVPGSMSARASGSALAHNLETSGHSLEESRLLNSGAETVSRKRRRPGATERLAIEMEANFDELAVAVAQSEEVSLGVLERLLTSFLSVYDQMNSEKLAKVEETASVLDSGLDMLSPSTNHSQEVFSSSSLGVYKFASQVVNILKKGGYEMFSPLANLPSEKLKLEENMSLTSTCLRLYVRNSHPQLCQLLVAWHREGLAVGPRLLCYVSRLAEEVATSSCSSLGLKGITGSLEVEPRDCTTRGSELDKTDTGGPPVVLDFDEEGEVLESSIEPPFEGIHENGGGRSAFGWPKTGHQSNLPKHVGNCVLKLQSRDFVSQTAVANAFKAYENFLKQTCSGSSTAFPPHSSGDTNDTPNHKLMEVTEEGGGAVTTVGKSNNSGLEADSLDAGLVTHLETCLVWNTQRLLQVLPSVFRYLPHLATGKEYIVQLLVTTVDPVELSNFEFWLTLGELAVMGNQSDALTRLTKASLSWEFMEQQYFWRLMVAELQAGSPSTVLQVHPQNTCGIGIFCFTSACSIC